MTKLMRRAVAPAALIAALSASASASAADQWTHWVSSKLQADIHSIDFTTPATMFAATYGDGIFNSVTTFIGPWSQQNSGFPTPFEQVNQVYTSGPNVLAATNSGLFRGTDPLTGGTWTQVGAVSGEPRQLPGSVNSVIIAGTRIVAAVVSAGFYYSDDAGAHWDKATGTPASETAFHIIQVGPALVAGSSSGVFVSFDQGTSWTLRSDGLPFANVRRVAVDPTNPLRMYALAGSDIYKVDLSDLAKGALWTAAGGSGPYGTQTSMGALPKAESLIVAPDGYGSGKVFAGTNNGVFATGDNGDHWGQMSGTTLAEPGIDPMTQQKVLSLGLGFPTGPNQDLTLMAGTPHGLFWLPMAPLAKAQNKTDVGTVQADATPRPGDVVEPPSETTIAQSYTGSRPYFFTYQWKRCTGKTNNLGTGCSPINGENERQHTVVPGDQTSYLAVDVTAHNIVSKNAVALPSQATTNKVAAPVGSEPIQKSPASTYGPVLSPSDSRVYGSIYTITPGTWVRGDTNGVLPGPVSYRYRWQRCNGACTDIPGTTTSTTSYQSTPDDIGSTLKVTVTITDPVYGSGSIDRATSSIYGKPADLVENARVIGEPFIGETLSSTVGTWNGQNVTYARQWKRCEADGTGCNSIIGATDPDYKLTEQDRGKTIRIHIESDDQDQFSHRYATTDSDPTGLAGDRPVPVVIGGGQVGDGGGGGGGQTGTGQVGTGPVGNTTSTTLTLTIPKKLKLGSSLAAPKSVKGFVKIKYQWLRNGKSIKRATKRTYKLARADRGKTIKCKVTLTDAKGKKTVRYTKALKVSEKLKR